MRPTSPPHGRRPETHHGTLQEYSFVSSDRHPRVTGYAEEQRWPGARGPHDLQHSTEPVGAPSFDWSVKIDNIHPTTYVRVFEKMLIELGYDTSGE